MNRRATITAAVLLSVPAQLALAGAAMPERVSLGAAGRQSNADSASPDLSANGRFLAFASTATNLVIGDANAARDVFVRDRDTGELRRVSLATDGTEADAVSFGPVISDDGEITVFASSATNLVAGDGNGATDVFVNERTTGATSRVSIATGGAEATGTSTSAAVSADGRHVAFASDASDLVSGDNNGVRDIFVHDRQTGITTRVSLNSAGIEADGSSDEPALSADGRYVAFWSNAENLVTGDGNFAPDVFVHDLDTGATVRVSIATSGAESDGFFAAAPSLSADGRFVAFESDAPSLAGAPIDLAQVFVHDRDADADGIYDEAGATATVLISASAAGQPGDGDHLAPELSADGRHVVFSSCSTNLTGPSSVRHAYLFDRDTDGDGIYDEIGATAMSRLSVDGGGISGNDDSGGFSRGVAISADGQTTAFESYASNLAANDTNGAGDVLVRETGASDPLMGSLSELPAEGNDRSRTPARSHDGSLVAFESSASNLVPGDANGKADIFVRDRSTGETTRVSVDSNGVEGNDLSDMPSMSADGRIVAFSSLASNFWAGDSGTYPDVFAHDRTTGETELITRGMGSAEANDMSFNPSITPDGRYVAFVSYAKNLVPNDMNFVRDVFVCDRDLDQITRVSVNDAGEEANNDAGELRNDNDGRFISDDGRFVAFTSIASNLVPNDTNDVSDVFVRDLVLQETTRVSIGSQGQQGDDYSAEQGALSMSADGQIIAFDSLAPNLVAGDTNNARDVFVHDRTTGETTRVSVSSSGEQGNEQSGIFGSVAISRDGRFVAFASAASNLVANDMNAEIDLFLHDRVDGTTIRLGINAEGSEANGRSSGGVFAGNGSLIAFWSDGTNLVSDDGNGERDIFVDDRGLPQPPAPCPSDLDGNGSTGFSDLSALLGRWGLCPGCPEDLDGDGAVGFTDLTMLLGGWGGCP